MTHDSADFRGSHASIVPACTDSRGLNLVPARGFRSRFWFRISIVAAHVRTGVGNGACRIDCVDHAQLGDSARTVDTVRESGLSSPLD